MIKTDSHHQPSSSSNPRVFYWDRNEHAYLWLDTLEPLSFDECEDAGLDGTGRSH